MGNPSQQEIQGNLSEDNQGTQEAGQAGCSASADILPEAASGTQMMELVPIN